MDKKANPYTRTDEEDMADGDDEADEDGEDDFDDDDDRKRNDNGRSNEHFGNRDKEEATGRHRNRNGFDAQALAHARQQQLLQQQQVNIQQQRVRQKSVLYDSVQQPRKRPPGKPVICNMCGQRFISVSGKSVTCPRCRRQRKAQPRVDANGNSNTSLFGHERSLPGPPGGGPPVPELELAATLQLAKHSNGAAGNGAALAEGRKLSRAFEAV